MQALKYEEYVPCLYTTQKDLLDRLDGTICRYEGEPVWVSYHSGIKLNLFNMVGQQIHPIKTITADDPLFDISMIECTYMNFVYDDKMQKRGKSDENYVVYLSRDPQKYWKQGFCIGHAIKTTIDGSYDTPDTGLMGRCQGLYDAISGTFPSFDQVMETFSSVKLGHKAEFAISKDIALRRSEVGVVFVFYRTEMVGWMEPGSRSIKIVENDLGWVIERYIKRLNIV